MKFAGLSQRGLVVLASMRGIDSSETDAVPVLDQAAQKTGRFFPELNRKRRAMLGSMVAQNDRRRKAPPTTSSSPTRQPAPAISRLAHRTSTIKDDIEESGLIGGITNRLKKTADSYLNQKLDEIEARIDRKLDEIDRRLAEWRDKEIANRIRILKITLWASVIVGVFSLIYSYVTVVLFPKPAPEGSTRAVPARILVPTTQQTQPAPTTQP